MMTSYFEKVTLAAPDPIFGLSQTFLEDQRLGKINYLIGYFKDDEGNTPLLNTVKKAEEHILNTQKHKEYLPIDGNKECSRHLSELVFGKELFKNIEPQLYHAQAIGGTGALRILGEFLKQFVGTGIAISDPTWPNHRGIFHHIGMDCQFYPYFDRTQFKIDWDKLLSMFQTLPEKTIVLFHANCHNPTGLDFTKEQWMALSEICHQRRLFPFFDAAYQGFSQGLDEDAWSIRYFIQQQHELAVAYSCAKNFSLYGERVGALMVYMHQKKDSAAIASQIKALMRSNYSNPPIHGAAIVSHILNTSSSAAEWKNELQNMRQRIERMRKLLVDRLQPHSEYFPIEYIRNTKGLFTYTGLSTDDVHHLKEKYAIYLIGDGRLNVTGLNQKNIDAFIDAIIHIKTHSRS